MGVGGVPSQSLPSLSSAFLVIKPRGKFLVARRSFPGSQSQEKKETEFKSLEF